MPEEKMNNRSTEALLSRRALAEKATPGPWRTDDLGNIFRMPQAPQEEYIPVVLLTRDYDKYVPSKTNAAHIAANSSDVIRADIDEILKLRADNARLQKSLEFANKLAAEQHEVAKLVWGGEVPSPLPGHRGATEEEAVAMFERLNCPWCGGSGHVGDCKEADQEVKTRLERLDREADWLAHICAEKMLDGTDEDSVNWWREKARDAAFLGRGDKSTQGE